MCFETVADFQRGKNSSRHFCMPPPLPPSPNVNILYNYSKMIKIRKFTLMQSGTDFTPVSPVIFLFQVAALWVRIQARVT